jgi:hypothetical protein
MTHQTLSVPIPRPRDPFAVAARRRHAGAHRKPAGALRRQALRDVQRELDRLKPPHD